MLQYLFAFLAAISYILPVHAQQQEPRSVSVTGSGRETAKPDYVVLILGFDSRNQELDQALTDNDERVRKSLSVLEDYKIDAKDYQTEDVNIQPTLRWPDNLDSLYYHVQKRMVLQIRQLNSFEPLFIKLLKSGVNRVDSVTFRTSQVEQLRKKAIEMAVSVAKEKATQLAGLLGQSLGKPLKIDEELESYYSGSGFGGGLGGGGYAEADPGPTFAFGEVEVRAKVRITFELLEGGEQKR